MYALKQNLKTGNSINNTLRTGMKGSITGACERGQRDCEHEWSYSAILSVVIKN